MQDAISKTSMLYWYPKIEGVGIPMPKTEIVQIPFNHLLRMLDGKMIPKRYVTKIMEATEKIGYPLFMRTDMGSAKHSWQQTCYVPTQKDLFQHVYCLIDTTMAMGMFGELDPNALVFREFLYLEDAFVAFDELPISKERRYFIKDGEVICHHPYWIEGAIEKDWRSNKPKHWRELLSKLNTEHDNEIRFLTVYSNQIAKVLSGYWSVDFAKVLGGNWYLIDMAEGEKSWHPEH
ncbi:hypothetical protein LCGC14_0925850 [marine sediment metagenome]|uniref:ATP-grasp domain-containing protein n=1 Tax=marine sediment metagenome TaxID=412755 RepID=A0A0F9NPJ0_9ZZZZ